MKQTILFLLLACNPFAVLLFLVHKDAGWLLYVNLFGTAVFGAFIWTTLGKDK